MKPLLLAVVLAVAGCGGGSNSNGTGSGSSNSDPVYHTEPALPSPVYSGNTSAAILTTQTVGDISQRVFSAITFANSAINEFSGSDPFSSYRNSLVTLDRPGPLGGNVTIKGNVSNSASEWLVETFNHYAYQVSNSGGTESYVANGTIILEGSSSKQSDSVTFGYQNYNLTGPGFDVTYSGTATLIQSLSQSNYGADTLNLDVGVLDENTGIDLEFVKFSLQTQAFSPALLGLIPTLINGRIYEQDIGYLDLASDGLANYVINSSGYDYPVSGGDLDVTGASGATMRIEPLNDSLFSASLKTGSGLSQLVQGARFDWSTFTQDISSTSSGGPVADVVVGSQTQTIVGQTVTVDGGFSHSSDGTFLTYKWTLQFVPPGSAATLNQDDEPEAVFTPDLPGDYMLQLTVSDGTHNATDYVDVSVTGANSLGAGVYVGESILAVEPVYGSSVGTPVRLYPFNRLRDTGEQNGLTYTYNWSMTDPPGSAATLSDAGTATPLFTPDVPGFYTVSYTVIDNNGAQYSSQSRVIDVGTDLSFEPPMQFMFDAYGNFDDLLILADLNGDSKPDVVFADTGSSGHYALYVMSNEGGGKFAVPAETDFASAPNGLAVGDLNGDGRPDIAVTFSSSVVVLLQGSDGSFSTQTTLSYPSGCTTYAPVVMIAKLFGASSNSLAVNGCSGELVTWNYSGGSFTSASTVTPVTGTGNDMSVLSFADMTGDSILDAVGQGTYNSQTGELVVPGQSGSGFGTPQVFDTVSGMPLTGDINDDKQADLIAEVTPSSSSGPSIDIFYGTGSGLGTTAINYPVPGFPAQPMVLADINGDGLPDLIVPQSFVSVSGNSSGWASGLGILEQQSDHTLGSEIFFPVDVNSVAAGQNSWVADMNGDGIPDIVTFTGSHLLVYYGNKP